jgi:hypothetical protein
MLSSSFILARGEDATFKVVFWVIVGIVWIISSIASSLKKKVEQSQKRVDVSEIPIELTSRMEVASPPLYRPPLLPRPAVPQRDAPRRSMPPGIPMLKARPVAPKLKSAQRGSAPPRMPPQRIAPPLPVGLTKQTITVNNPRPAVSTAPPAKAESPASQLARALQRPGALQTQIVIAEILGKPLALRESLLPRA